MVKDLVSIELPMATVFMMLMHCTHPSCIRVCLSSWTKSHFQWWRNNYKLEHNVRNGNKGAKASGYIQWYCIGVHRFHGEDLDQKI